MKKLKPWQWALITLGIAGIVVGIGFIPITETEQLDYTSTDRTWLVWEEGAAYDEVWLSEYEAMTWADFLSYLPGDYLRDGSMLSWRPPGYEIGREVRLENTSSEGGQFTVRFYYREWVEGDIFYHEQQRYLNPGEYAQFSMIWDRELDDPYFSWEQIEVIAPKVKETERLFWR